MGACFRVFRVRSWLSDETLDRIVNDQLNDVEKLVLLNCFMSDIKKQIRLWRESKDGNN